MKDCLWNNPRLLLEQAKNLDLAGFNEAAKGCRERADKVTSVMERFGDTPRSAKILEEPVEGGR